MKRMVPWAVAVWLGLGLGATVRADMWTNVAGHVITAKLLAIEDGQALLQEHNGHLRHVPLTSLKPADRERAEGQTGAEPPPAGLKIPFAQAQEDLNRAAQFLRGGKITRKQYTARCQAIKQRFEHFGRQALQNEGAPADPAILDRLKRRLEKTEHNGDTTVPPPGNP